MKLFPSKESNLEAEMDPLVFLLGGVGVAVAAFIVRNVVAKNRHEAEQQVRDAALELEMSQEAARRAREANAAAPLVDSPNPQLQLADSAKAVLSGFSELETFQDVAAWDSRAQDLANQIHAECDRLTAFVAKADAVIVTHGRSPSAPKHVHAAELQKTRDLTKQAKAAVQQLAPLYDDLLQRIDFTPDNKADQQALLKELRSQKKELALQKREQKAAATAVRREARVASSTAGISDLGVLGSSYHANSAARERRAIRQQKEAALRPYEDAAAALERQIAAVERQISWVVRFGDSPEK